jgi:hypothetical protein
MKKSLYTIVILCLLGAAVGTVTWHAGYRIDLTGELAPAWVQAIGSILAIGAAAWIAQRQHRQAVKLEERKLAVAERQKLEVIKALMVRSLGLANDVCKACESNAEEDIEQISPLLMLDTHAALMALPVFEIPHWQLALDVLMVGRALGSLNEQFLSLPRISPETFEEFKKALSDLHELAQEIKQVAEDSVDVCRSEIVLREGGLYG